MDALRIGGRTVTPGKTPVLIAGPCVLVQGLSVRTYLSACIDAYSRYVVAARYYLRESLDVLCDTLIRALAIVEGRQLHRVPGVAQVDEINAFDDPSLLHVEAGHDLDRFHKTLPRIYLRMQMQP